MQTSSNETKGRVVYFSHGGGPLPILGDAGHQAMVDFMTDLPAKLIAPEAILVISAHWEQNTATLMTSPAPGMFYDYYGFPEEAYTITYPAPGSPQLAQKVAGLLQANNIPSANDPQRGYDHGLFIPLKLMYPQANIPCAQLSILHDLNPQSHLRLGKALRPLLDENILILGSGFSFHNLRAFFSSAIGAPDPANESFQNWLIDTCAGEHSQAEREELLSNWAQAPAARYCQPREDHLLPLHVCQGLAGSPAKVIFDDAILGKRGIAFMW